MIIQSLLDTDLYKFTMMQVVLHHFPNAQIEYKFQLRKKNVDLTPFADEIREEINNLGKLQLTEDELSYLQKLPYLSDDFIEQLRHFRLNPNTITINTKKHFELTIQGQWLETILFEVPILAIICEVYYRNTYPKPNYSEGEKRLCDKIKLAKSQTNPDDFKLMEFGTRRRFSRQWQKRVIEILKAEFSDYMVGTSNILFAKEFNLNPVGTMAHEYIQACQSLAPDLASSQKFAFSTWLQEYKDQLGIALSDTLGSDAFFHDFNKHFCQNYSGARHDSGDPFVWGERFIKHLQSYNIDPKTKAMVFSDSLTFPKALEILKQFRNRSNLVFGIGTNLTNDLGYDAIDIVIKASECNGQPVAKISDSPGKQVCKDAEYLTHLRNEFGIESL